MMNSIPCFTVGTKHLALNASSILRRTKREPAVPKTSVRALKLLAVYRIFILYIFGKKYLY